MTKSKNAGDHQPKSPKHLQKKSGGTNTYSLQTRKSITDLILWYGNSKGNCAQQWNLSVPLNFNVSSSQKSKVDKYVPLVSELHQMYLDYLYQIVPVIIGALGAVPKSLPEHLKKLNIDKCNNTIRRLQKAAITGSMKIMKTFLAM